MLIKDKGEDLILMANQLPPTTHLVVLLSRDRPQPNDAIRPGGSQQCRPLGQEGWGRRKGQCTHAPLMLAHGLQGLTGCPIPKPDRAVGIATGDSLAVGAKSNATEKMGMSLQKVTNLATFDEGLHH